MFALALAASEASWFPQERSWTLALRAFSNREAVQQLAQFFDRLAFPPVAVCTVVVAAAIVARNVDVRWAFLVLASVVVVPICSLVKELVGPTPLHLSLEGPSTAGNFPSGHVAYATAVFGLLLALGWRHHRPEVVAVMVGIVVSMGPSVVMLSAHEPTDVIGGYALGGAWAAVLLLVAGRMRHDSVTGGNRGPRDPT